MPEEGYELDGVNHVGFWFGTEPEGTNARDYILYNYFYNVKDYFFDMWKNGSFAVRNSKYKLMHTHDSTTYGNWFAYDDKIDNDDSLAESFCSQSLAMTGDFTYFLFDLENDPYETTNIYDFGSTATEDAKTELYAMLDVFASKAREMDGDIEARNKHTLQAWKKHDDYIVPWVDEDDISSEYDGLYPLDCYNKPTSAPTNPPTIAPTSAKPTTAPTTAKPTSEPTSEDDDGDADTSAPSYKPTSKPTDASDDEDATSAPSNKPTSKPTHKGDDDWVSAHIYIKHNTLYTYLYT